ncbi:hypothetical protein N7494_004706 [Penicillium frequentans]|uniref:Xylanolytic transcriptional activator regulatory domain-containing protein n=1 Tax=Penicillium frequentans TaxID=3151616 RepID=A0AAD6D364_9EURO|nr:hypothetical protein N7494_004706 [Penicillium glabrum]
MIAATPSHLATSLNLRASKDRHQGGAPQPQLKESWLYTKYLEDTLRRRDDHASSSTIPDLFSPLTFDKSLKIFRWHLQHCVPVGITSSQLESIFNFNEFAGQLTAQPPAAIPSANYVEPLWPSRLLVEQAIEYFTLNRLYAIIPVVESDVLVSLLDANTFDQNEGSLSAVNKACLGAFTALVIQMSHHDLSFTHATPDSYMQTALSLLPQLTLEHSNIRALEALLMMTLYIAPLGQPQTAELLLSMAVRILSNLGAYTNENSCPVNESSNREHLRALFWLCYSIDKEMCLRQCQAPLISNNDCDLDLPAAYVPLSSKEQFFEYQQDSRQLLFPTDLRLTIFKSKLYDRLYSHSSLRTPEAIRLRLIRELDDELHELKSLFPAACQPEKLISADTPHGTFRDLSMRGVCIHLDYYHCLTKIHGAILVGVNATKDLSTLSSSLELCYQAARSTLVYLSRMRHLITTETYWIFAQFLLTAVLTLYHRLVTQSDRLDSQADVRILKDTLEIFVQTETNSSPSVPPFTITEAFIRHLIESLRR